MPHAAQCQAKVLVMEQDANRAAELSHRLRFLNYEPVVAAGAGCIERFSAESGIAVMLGDTIVGGELESAVRDLLSTRPNLPVLLASAAPKPEFVAKEAWPLELPIRRSQLSQLLTRAERYEVRDQRQRLTGSSSRIRKVRTLIEQVADFDTNVLVTGESGTGKELVARTIHDLSARAGRPFVPINCGAIPPDLLESELFGHEKGAFTGAVSSRVGRFELAEGGTLFLDEIGDMSLPMQVKLLRVLQERTFERVGSNETRECNVRIIAATHRDLPAMAAEGTFREDLFYRLNVFPIDMPPLCKRAADLPQLLEELLVQHQPGVDQRLRLTPAALDALARYPWPGNIRELGNLVERLAIMFPEGEIDLSDLPQKYQVAAAAPALDSEPAATAPGTADLKQYLQDVERELIAQALENAGGVVAKAARILKMQRTTLLEKINKYGIS
jgi:sigma-54 dependent transcriptional regulator, flagellar regulatory protein